MSKQKKQSVIQNYRKPYRNIIHHIAINFQKEKPRQENKRVY